MDQGSQSKGEAESHSPFPLFTSYTCMSNERSLSSNKTQMRHSLGLKCLVGNIESQSPWKRERERKRYP